MPSACASSFAVQTRSLRSALISSGVTPRPSPSRAFDASPGRSASEARVAPTTRATMSALGFASRVPASLLVRRARLRRARTRSRAVTAATPARTASDDGDGGTGGLPDAAVGTDRRGGARHDDAPRARGAPTSAPSTSATAWRRRRRSRAPCSAAGSAARPTTPARDGRRRRGERRPTSTRSTPATTTAATGGADGGAPSRRLSHGVALPHARGVGPAHHRARRAGRDVVRDAALHGRRHARSRQALHGRDRRPRRDRRRRRRARARRVHRRPHDRRRQGSRPHGPRGARYARRAARPHGALAVRAVGSQTDDARRARRAEEGRLAVRRRARSTRSATRRSSPLPSPAQLAVGAAADDRRRDDAASDSWVSAARRARPHGGSLHTGFVLTGAGPDSRSRCSGAPTRARRATARPARSFAESSSALARACRSRRWSSSPTRIVGDGRRGAQIEIVADGVDALPELVDVERDRDLAHGVGELAVLDPEAATRRARSRR